MKMRNATLVLALAAAWGISAPAAAQEQPVAEASRSGIARTHAESTVEPNKSQRIPTPAHEIL